MLPLLRGYHFWYHTHILYLSFTYQGKNSPTLKSQRTQQFGQSKWAIWIKCIQPQSGNKTMNQEKKCRKKTLRITISVKDFQKSGHSNVYLLCLAWWPECVDILIPSTSHTHSFQSMETSDGHPHVWSQPRKVGIVQWPETTAYQDLPVSQQACSSGDLWHTYRKEKQHVTFI